jgi:hypothetical protein
MACYYASVWNLTCSLFFHEQHLKLLLATIILKVMNLFIYLFWCDISQCQTSIFIIINHNVMATSKRKSLQLNV